MGRGTGATLPLFLLVSFHLVAVAPDISAAESPDTSAAGSSDTSRVGSQATSEVESPAVLGISLSLKAPVMGSNDPDIVYFIRLNPGESLDSALTRGQVIATNQADDDRLLVLGTMPGTYVAVAAAFRESHVRQPDVVRGGAVPFQSGSSSISGRSATMVWRTKNTFVSVGYDPYQLKEDVYRTYFARDVIESTAVTVGPDAFVYVGHLVVKESTGIAHGDEVQKHFQQLLEGKSAKESGALRAITGTHSYRGSLREIRRDRESEERFLEKTAKKLKKTEWAALLQKRRAELRGSPSTEH